MIEGGCLCGEIRYTVEGSITDVSHCHCSMCRKAHGAAFATFGTVGREHLTWQSGKKHMREYRSSADLERVFCDLCGSTLLCRSSDEPNVEYMALGTVDGTFDCPPAYHIWVGSMAPWYSITDDLPQFAEED